METNDKNQNHPGTELNQTLQQDAFFREVRMPIDTAADAVSQAVFIKDLRVWMAENKIGQGTLAEKVGISTTQISQIINNKYPGDAGPAIKKIADYMDTVQRRKRVEKGNGFVYTKTAKRIFSVIKETQTYSDDAEARIGMIIGDSGHGKSVCLKQFVRVNTNAVYVELDDTMSSTALFSEIAKELKIDYTGGVKTLTQRIVERLSGRLMTILLDEASALDVGKLNQLRQIICVRCKCPLIIAGNAHLLNTINEDVTRKGYESLDQFRSRLLTILNLNDLATGGGNDDDGLYTEDDVRKLYEYGGISLTKDAKKTLRRICRTPKTGRLRTCSIIITMLHRITEIRNSEVISSADIFYAIEQLGLPIMNQKSIRKGQNEDEQVESEVRARTA
jgi:DNA transposition AAA+ family ATPase